MKISEFHYYDIFRNKTRFLIFIPYKNYVRSFILRIENNFESDEK